MSLFSQCLVLIINKSPIIVARPLYCPESAVGFPEDFHAILVGHLAGVGGEQPTHCFPRVPCQHVEFIRHKAVIGHFQIRHAAVLLIYFILADIGFHNVDN